MLKSEFREVVWLIKSWGLYLILLIKSNLLICFLYPLQMLAGSRIVIYFSAYFSRYLLMVTGMSVVTGMKVYTCYSYYSFILLILLFMRSIAELSTTPIFYILSLLLTLLLLSWWLVLMGELLDWLTELELELEGDGLMGYRLLAIYRLLAEYWRLGCVCWLYEFKCTLLSYIASLFILSISYIYCND